MTLVAIFLAVGFVAYDPTILPFNLLGNDCRIKGNISYNTGERIYHVPGGEFYSRTRIDTSRGERWFCSEEEAQAAGWRRSMR